MYPVLPFADADFSLADMQGKPWTLKNVRGKVVLLNFWVACRRMRIRSTTPSSNRGAALLK